MGIHALQNLAPIASTESAAGSATGATNNANSECIHPVQVVMPVDDIDCSSEFSPLAF